MLDSSGGKHAPKILQQVGFIALNKTGPQISFYLFNKLETGILHHKVKQEKNSSVPKTKGKLVKWFLI